MRRKLRCANFRFYLGLKLIQLYNNGVGIRQHIYVSFGPARTSSEEGQKHAAS